MFNIVKVCRFNHIPGELGGQEVYLPPPSDFLS